MSYNLAADRAHKHEQLLATITTAIHGTDSASWKTRAFEVSDALHAAGYHNGDLDPDGCVVQSDWRDCPACSMHPERHTDGEPPMSGHTIPTPAPPSHLADLAHLAYQWLEYAAELPGLTVKSKVRAETLRLCARQLQAVAGLPGGEPR